MFCSEHRLTKFNLNTNDHILTQYMHSEVGLFTDASVVNMLRNRPEEQEQGSFVYLKYI